MAIDAPRSLVGVPRAELEGRRERLLELVRAEGLTGYVLFDESYIRYLTNFWFLSTERPVGFAQSASGDMVVFVPEFEVERVRAETSFAVASYPEYPGTEHPMLLLAGVLDSFGIGGRIGADQDGYPGILGYQGPALSVVASAIVAPLSAPILPPMPRPSSTRARRSIGCSVPGYSG